MLCSFVLRFLICCMFFGCDFCFSYIVRYFEILARDVESVLFVIFVVDLFMFCMCVMVILCFLCIELILFLCVYVVVIAVSRDFFTFIVRSSFVASSFFFVWWSWFCKFLCLSLSVVFIVMYDLSLVLYLCLRCLRFFVYSFVAYFNFCVWFVVVFFARFVLCVLCCVFILCMVNWMVLVMECFSCFVCFLFIIFMCLWCEVVRRLIL